MESVYHDQEIHLSDPYNNIHHSYQFHHELELTKLLWMFRESERRRAHPFRGHL